MKILMLTPYLPYPLYSGGQIRSYNLIKNLSQKHEITLFSFIRNKKEEDYVASLRKYCHNVKVFIKRPPWSLHSLILSGVTVYPLVVCMYLKKSLRLAIEEAIDRERFDLIHAETFYVMPNIPANTIPTILVEQTIEYLVYQHYTDIVKNLPLKLLMQYDVGKIKVWEKKFWQKATRVVAMSNSDKEQMQKLAPGLTVDLVPNGVDTEFFLPKSLSLTKSPQTVLFVGNFKWLQNREAASILAKSIWPKVKKALPAAHLWIIGRYPTREIYHFSSDTITVSDNVDDIRRAYQKSDVLLAPIYGPGGTRYKILESMATGLPVVTTSTGIEGLDVVDGRDALIRDTPEGLASATVDLLTNRQLYLKLAKNSRKLIEENFNWKKIASMLDSIYQKAAYGKKN